MKIFKDTTLQKGLERYLPKLSIEETEKIYSVLGSEVIKGSFDGRSYDTFYSQLETLFEEDNFLVNSENMELGNKIYRELQKRSKTYNVPLNASPNYIRRKRVRELDLLKRIRGEIRNESENR